MKSMFSNYLKVALGLIKICRNWPVVIYAKVFNRQIKKINIRGGGIFEINGQFGKADLSMFIEIWHYKFYTPPELPIKSDAIVFDIGANNGFFTIYAARLARQGRVYAFEPVPALKKIIDRNASANKLHNVRVENLAVGGKTGRQAFFLSSAHNGCHSLYARANTSGKIVVSTVTLKSYCQTNKIAMIDFLKLDCEGAEYEILTEKNIAFIKKTVKVISMEYHDNIVKAHTHQEILALLRGAGFTAEARNGFLYAKNIKLFA